MKFMHTSLVLALLAITKFAVAAPALDTAVSNAALTPRAAAGSPAFLLKRCNRSCYENQYEACSSGCACGDECVPDNCIAGCITEASKLVMNFHPVV